MDCFGNQLIYFDGAMGTMLQAAGLAGGEEPESWNILHPEAVKRIHLDYLRSGADIIIANTFGVVKQHFLDKAQAYMIAGVKIAREAVLEEKKGFVAADIGPLGRFLQPYGDVPFECAVEIFRNVAISGITAGADLLLVETMTDMFELKAAVLGVKEAIQYLGRDLPLICSLSFCVNGRLLTGGDIRGTVAMLEGLGINAIGLNCGNEPYALMDNVKALLRWSSLPVFVCPNASLPVMESGKTVFPVNAETFAQGMREIAELGAWGVGGCCGTTPEYIEAICRFTAGMKLKTREKYDDCVVSGRTGSLALNQKPVMIGENINPTGKPHMRKALMEKDMDFLVGEAIDQARAGADALDINVWDLEINEAEILPLAILSIQMGCGLPLQLDSSNPAALEAALRVYIGKPIINSVCGKKQVMDSVFPLAAKYGGVVVALTLDENGIPPTADGRVAIARRIIEESKKYGIQQSNLLFDALAMPVSTQEDSALVTLQTVSRLSQELGVKTILGVSNISFGLPDRRLLNAAFMAMAVSHGLSAAILNPLDETMRCIWSAAMAVAGKDHNFSQYLGHHVLSSNG